VVDNADIIVLGNGDERFAPLAQQALSGKHVVDLIGFMPTASRAGSEGICW
jgi:GDP-mannose 6-dehydrogenase